MRPPIRVPAAFSARLLVPLALVCCAPFAAADRLVTQDGRILAPKKARPEGAGYKLEFEHGSIVLPDKSLVREIEIEGDMADYVPQSDDEKQKLAQGYVKYRGRWMSAPAYQEELRKNFEEGKKRTEDIKAHSDWINAWKKETKHFVFKTNTSPQLLDYYSELLEAYYDLQDERIGIHPPVALARKKMAVNIFKSNADFHKYGSEDNPAVLGYFSPSGKSLNFYHEYSEPEQTTWVALHECTHLLTYLVDPEYEPQIWVNEGVADYFGSSKVTRKNGKIVIEPGQLQTDRILTVQQALKDEKAAGPATAGAKAKGFEGRPFTKLEDLFMLKHDEFDGFQYAHAWSFVYFLNTAQNGKYAKAFSKFFKGLYTTEKGLPVKTDDGWKRVDPKDIRDYLLAKLGVKDVAALEAEWKAFVAAIPIDGVPARLKRGLNSVRRGDFESALEDLDAAIAGGATDPRAWSARSLAEMRLGKPAEALVDAQHAVELNPLNARYHYSLSLMMLGIGTSGGPGFKISFEDGQKIKNDDAKAQAGLAMELDPENDRFREWFDGFE
jgi:hypothetical protein